MSNYNDEDERTRLAGSLKLAELEAYFKRTLELISDEITKNDSEFIQFKGLVKAAAQAKQITEPPSSSSGKNSKFRIISDIRLNSSPGAVVQKPSPGALPKLNLTLPEANDELPDLDEWCSY